MRKNKTYQLKHVTNRLIPALVDITHRKANIEKAVKMNIYSSFRKLNLIFYQKKIKFLFEIIVVKIFINYFHIIYGNDYNLIGSLANLNQNLADELWFLSI